MASRLHQLLQPYQPNESDPFDRVKAAHLLNRAGFGGTSAEIDQVVKLGPADAVDWLFDFPDASADEQSQTDVPDLSAIEDYPETFRELRDMMQGKNEEERRMLQMQFQQANREALLATGSWWVKRMAYGPHPLQEKLTLFWHGHFTTSAKDERSASLMWNQNELLRRNAAKNFSQFVHAVARDPAMLDYLNNQQNRKEKPNENFARELMELFTLGIGNYTEQDIKEAARAFTGWSHEGDDFVFRKGAHDFGSKTFFGKKGNFDGGDVIDIILATPTCSRYIATKMFSFFAYDVNDEALGASLANVLRESKYDIRPLLRTIFTSKAFYSPACVGAQIKSPVQLVVGTVRMLNLPMPPAMVLHRPLEQMGQVPLLPPNVKGWPGGRTWINTSTLFVRYNTAVALAGRGEFPRESGDADAVVDRWVSRLIQRPLGSDKRQVLLESLQSEGSTRGMVQLIVSMPEYQLC